MTEQERTDAFKKEVEALSQKYGIGIVAVLVVEQHSNNFATTKAQLAFAVNEVKETNKGS